MQSNLQAEQAIGLHRKIRTDTRESTRGLQEVGMMLQAGREVCEQKELLNRVGFLQVPRATTTPSLDLAPQRKLGLVMGQRAGTPSWCPG